MAKKIIEPENWSTEAIPLMIPRVGTRIKLTQDWSFRLYNEGRNTKVMQLFGLESIPARFTPRDQFGRCKSIKDEIKEGNKIPRNCWTKITLYKGTVLKVDRIYIKQESSKEYGMNAGGEYNSLTFYIDDAPDDLVMLDVLCGTKTVLRNGKKKLRPRFWAKLSDVNTIKCVVDLETVAKY